MCEIRSSIAFGTDTHTPTGVLVLPLHTPAALIWLLGRPHPRLLSLEDGRNNGRDQRNVCWYISRREELLYRFPIVFVASVSGGQGVLDAKHQADTKQLSFTFFKRLLLSEIWWDQRSSFFFYLPAGPVWHDLVWDPCKLDGMIAMIFLRAPNLLIIQHCVPILISTVNPASWAPCTGVWPFALWLASCCDIVNI